MHRRLLDWLEDRTGIEGAVKHFALREVRLPPVGPRYLGAWRCSRSSSTYSAATGILLALNYAPAPGAAYGSVRQIMTQVMAGRLLRALHQWGASLMIVVGCWLCIWSRPSCSAHHKKPREGHRLDRGRHSSSADVGTLD